MPQFILKIQLGNDAMQTRNDLAMALKDASERVRCEILSSGKIFDINGNSVGSWMVK